MSTIFIDRAANGAEHNLIQAFSRTNRIYDKNKVYGQIVTFQAPKLFKESVDNAVRLYSAGSTQTALLADWKEVESAFRKSLKALRISAETPEEVPGMSIKEKKNIVCQLILTSFCANEIILHSMKIICWLDMVFWKMSIRIMQDST